MTQLLEQLQWRYATKKMDPSKTVPQDKLDRIVEAARLAPTSSGLQPFELLVVSNAEVRKQIRAVANDQSQVTDGSHLLVFAAWDNYTPERINHMFDLVFGHLLILSRSISPAPCAAPSHVCSDVHAIPG